MGHGEISTNYNVSKTLSNSATPGLIASITVVNPTTISTTAAYPTPGPTTDNYTKATKSINSDHFIWITNHFCKRATHEIDCVTGLQQLDCLGIRVHTFVSLQHTISTYHPSIVMRIASYVVSGWGRMEERIVVVGLKLQFMVALLISESDQFSVLWRPDSLPQCYREGNFTVILFWENTQLSMKLLFLQHYY